MDSVKRKIFAAIVGAGLLICLLVCPSASAQTTRGTIFGTVTDASGAMVSDAQVTITSVATGETRTTTTNSEGGYVVPALLPGKYNVSAGKEHFENASVGPVAVEVDARQEVNVKLSVAGTQTQLTVTSAAPIVESGNSTVGQVIDEKTIVDMPLNGRNFLQLVTLSAGATPTGNGSDTNGFNRPSVNISGGRESSNQFTIDGVFDNAIHFEGLNLQPNVDAIEEFKVQRNSFSAEYGFGTAIVNVATKSGTNQFHGTAFEFLRNDIFDAKQFNDKPTDPKPPYRQNQFGGVFGGPIYKNKTFFFFSYDGFRSRQSVTIPGILPSQAMISGNFGSETILDPANNYQPFTNNTIPSDRFSQISKNILAQLPTLPSAAGDFTRTGSNKNDFDQWSIRLDQRFGEKDTVFARYAWGNTDIYTPGLFAQTGSSVSDTPVNAGAQWTHVFTGNVLNEARLGFNRNLQVRAQDGEDNSQLNVLAPMQNIDHEPVNFGLPFIQLAGYSAFGTPITLPEIVGGNTLQISDSLNWVRGRHTFKFGGEFRNTQMPHTPFVASRGQYVFTGSATGDPVADFLLGYPLVAVGAGKGPALSCR